MMGRLNHDQEQFFYSFQLDEAVPPEVRSLVLGETAIAAPNARALSVLAILPGSSSWG